MADWHEDLMEALHSGDAEYMRAMLDRVPRESLEQAVSAIESLAVAALDGGDDERALVCLDQLAAAKPEDPDVFRRRAHLHMRREAYDLALVDAVRLAELQPQDAGAFVLQAEALLAAGNRAEAHSAFVQAAQLDPSDESVRIRLASLSDVAQASSSLPRIVFDPALLRDPSVPENASKAMVDGLTRLLSRYGHHQSVRNAADRLSDPAWVEAWRGALAQCAGDSVYFCGCELGILPLLALELGAARVYLQARNPLEQRVASGLVQKHQLVRWHATFADSIADMDQDARRAAFEAYNEHIVFVDEGLAAEGIACDWLVFADFDHGLLTTGIAAAVEDCRRRGVVPARGVLPRGAEVEAMGVRWCYPGTDFDFSALGSMRWSPQAEALDLPETAWSAATVTVPVAALDFAELRADAREQSLPVTDDGPLDAILFWYTLDFGAARLSTAPDQGLVCLKPAVQYLDPTTYRAGDTPVLRTRIETTRMCFEVDAPRALPREYRLPSWYVPMMIDGPRNTAYRQALGALRSDDVVLELGSGGGLLAMLAAQAGSRQVHGCEVHPRIHDMGCRIVSDNGFDDAVHIVNKDCRQLALEQDLPRRADVVLFELFDCGLIGEGILHFLEYVRRHLSTEDARLVPMRARVRGMLVESRIDTLAGFDANLLNPFLFSPSYMNVDASKLRYRPLSAPFDVFAFDFADATPNPQEEKIQVETTAAGTVGAVLFWFDLDLDADTTISNAPDARPSYHWHQAMQYLPEIAVEGGMPLALTAKHQGSAIAFAWSEGGVPQEAYSRLPRVDPTSWAQATELENHTQQLMQFARGNPEEYKRIADIALRIAIDPARFDIEPKVAQRFVSMFL